MSASLLLAGLLVGASFLSGISVSAGHLDVRPEQAAAPLVALVVLVRPLRGRVPAAAALALVFLAAGAFGSFGEPESGRALVHTARLAVTILPLVLLPLLLDRADAEKAWDLFLGFALLESLAALGAATAHRLAGTTWGMTFEHRLGYAHPHGTLLEPNILGALSAVAAVAFLLRALDPALARARRLLAAAAFFTTTAVAGVSLTRAAWIALPLVAGLVLVLRAPRERRGRALLAAAAVGTLAGVGLALLVAARGEWRDARTGIAGKVASLANLAEDRNVGVRLRSYEAALDLFRERPFLGAGHGAMERLPGTEDRTLAWAGNLEVHLLADTGIVGLAALGALCAIVLAGSLRRRGRRALERSGALLVVILCAQATETSWLASFWVLLGLALAADAPARAARKQKVLFVHPSDELYGSDRVLLELIRSLPRERVEPLVLVSTDVAYEGRLSAKLAEMEVPVRRFRLGVLRRRTIASPWALARLALDAALAAARVAFLCVRERVDVVHANTITVLPAALAARLAGRPLVWQIHEIVPPRRLRPLFLRVVGLLATKLVAVSEAVRTALGPAGARAEVVPNGVALPAPGPSPEEPPVVLFAGRLAEHKGPDVLLDAAGLLGARHPEARFVLVGDEFAGAVAFRHALEERARRLGIAERVSFLPFTEEIAPLLSRATVLVNPSRRPEPFGLTILEAMARGRPVVASAEGGPAEVIEDGVSGRLVPPGDPTALAAALDALLSDPAAARAMGAAARERAARFPLSRPAARLMGIYEELGGA